MFHTLTAHSHDHGVACSRTETLERRLARLADAGPMAIEDRLNQLEGEWSAGRAAKATLAVVILVGTILAVGVSGWWAILPAVAGFLLLQNLYTRDSWLMKVIREAGLRGRGEIEHEKLALKALRGDFRGLPTVHDIEAQDDIARLEGEGGIVIEVEATKVDPKEAVREVIHATYQ